MSVTSDRLAGGTRARGRAAAALLAVGCCFGVGAGCTGSNAGSSTAASLATAADAKEALASGTGGAAGSAPVAGAARPASGTAGLAAGSAVRGGSSRGSALDVAAAQRSRILSATVDLQVSDVRAAVADATSAVVGAGGFVGSADARAATPREAAVATLTLRAPAGSFDRVVAAVAALGTVRSSTRTEQDVTSQVADLQSRLATDRASIARVRLLFAKATSVGSVIALESALTDRESELESLEAQQRALAGQVGDATIAVTLHGPAPTKAVVHHAAARHAGFTTGLRDGWRALATFTRRTTVVLGALLPFAPFALVGVGLVWWRVRRARVVRPPTPRPTV